MLGAIIGDVIGSVYEFKNPVPNRVDFELFSARSKFTDDTVCSVAIADAILNGKTYADALLEWCQKYPAAGYGKIFSTWLISRGEYKIESFGNGSAMRVSPCAYAFDTLERVLDEAKKSAECTHSHPEGIKGAQATAAAIYMARTGETKEAIKKYVVNTFGYDLDRTVDELIATHKWNATCQETVPESIIAFLESSDLESAIRNAIAMKGDADTMAAIAGSIAYAFYPEIDTDLVLNTIEVLDGPLLEVASQFHAKYIPVK